MLAVAPANLPPDKYELFHALCLADRVMKAVDTTIQNGALDSRSAIADARLEFGTPGEYKWLTLAEERDNSETAPPSPRDTTHLKLVLYVSNGVRGTPGRVVTPEFLVDLVPGAELDMQKVTPQPGCLNKTCETFWRRAGLWTSRKTLPLRSHARRPPSPPSPQPQAEGRGW